MTNLLQFVAEESLQFLSLRCPQTLQGSQLWDSCRVVSSCLDSHERKSGVLPNPGQTCEDRAGSRCHPSHQKLSFLLISMKEAETVGSHVQGLLGVSSR